MGLDAAIYKDVDEEHLLECISIGNITRVEHIRKCIQNIQSDSPVLLENVLYSGTHCGDKLSLEQIKVALEEIQRLSANPLTDAYLQSFITEFGGLLQRALARGLPVVF